MMEILFKEEINGEKQIAPIPIINPVVGIDKEKRVKFKAEAILDIAAPFSQIPKWLIEACNIDKFDKLVWIGDKKASRDIYCDAYLVDLNIDGHLYALEFLIESPDDDVHIGRDVLVNATVSVDWGSKPNRGNATFRRPV